MDGESPCTSLIRTHRHSGDGSTGVNFEIGQTPPQGESSGAYASANLLQLVSAHEVQGRDSGALGADDVHRVTITGGILSPHPLRPVQRGGEGDLNEFCSACARYLSRPFSYSP